MKAAPDQVAELRRQLEDCEIALGDSIRTEIATSYSPGVWDDAHYMDGEATGDGSEYVDWWE